MMPSFLFAGLCVLVVVLLFQEPTSAFLPPLQQPQYRPPPARAPTCWSTRRRLAPQSLFSSNNSETTSARESLPLRTELLELLETTPANAPTSRDSTQSILQVVRKLEKECPTDEKHVVSKLQGTWELLWTTQDTSSEQYNSLPPILNWINPLENQSYSNNPNGAEGRLNPVLPLPVQDQLEKIGLIKVGEELANVRSTQSVDLQRQRVRNVVTFGIPSLGGDNNNRRASLTVDIRITPPDPAHLRRINVKFQACRVVVPKSPIDINIPLGIIGPTGWLETTFVDDDVRITRGHKGSVFVLKRPSS